MTRSNKLAIWAIGALTTTTGMVNADILYDTLPELVSTTGSQWRLIGSTSNYLGIQSFIGGSAVFGTSLDMQVADDFTLAHASTIDRLTVDMNTGLGLDPVNLPEAITVEFFSDAGGQPGDASSYTLMVDSNRLTREYSLSNPGPYVHGGFRLGIDLSNLGIELAAGNWWFSVVGVAEDTYYTVVRRNDQTTGNAIHARNGGLAHGNGSPIGLWGSYEWDPFGDLNSGFGLHGDLNARIEGTSVPAPGVAGVLGLIGLGLVSHRRR